MEKNEFSKKLKNWIDYYKWYVIIGVLLAVFLVRYIGGILGASGNRPDVQVAYVGKYPLTENAGKALEAAMMPFAGDYNGDGKIIVRIRKYLTADRQSVAEAMEGAGASQISLAGDLGDCESYIFLMDDPETFQINWQVLAMPDGSCPAPSDYSTGNKVFAFAFDAEGLEEEDTAGLKGLFAGRRCFYTEKTCQNIERLPAFWENLKKEFADGSEPA